MNRIKRIAATGAMALGIVAGATVVAPVVTAAPAQAATPSMCYTYYNWNWQPARACYIDYNWFEETVLRKKDGWYNVPFSTRT